MTLKKEQVTQSPLTSIDTEGEDELDLAVPVPQHHSSDPAPMPPNRQVSLSRAVLAGLALILFIVIALFLFRKSLASSETKQINSIAVLPMENLSGDSNQEYFADGMTDELIANLARVSSLRVISRTTAMEYKGTP